MVNVKKRYIGKSSGINVVFGCESLIGDSLERACIVCERVTGSHKSKIAASVAEKTISFNLYAT